MQNSYFLRTISPRTVYFSCSKLDPVLIVPCTGANPGNALHCFSCVDPLLPIFHIFDLLLFFPCFVWLCDMVRRQVFRDSGK